MCKQTMLLHGEYIMVVENVTGNSDSFMDEWEAKKKQNDSLHKKASKKIKDMCVFAKKLVGR